MSPRAARSPAPGPAPDIALADRLFTELRTRTADGRGVTRTSYGEGEALAHAIVRREAEVLGLRIATDAALNLYMTLPGAAPGPAILIGSHLDSVPRGGNFDGAAGVLMGLSVLSGLVRAGEEPPCDVTVMAIRAEESAWFGSSYVGSRAAFGLLDAAALDGVTRAGDGVTLGAAIAAAGGRVEALRQGQAHLVPQTIRCFVEPHIEQGPALTGKGFPIGIVTGIRGSFRHRAALCRGAYAHSGATPRGDRQDAVVGFAALVTQMEHFWDEAEAAGEDLTITFGEAATELGEASFSKVAALLRFSLDIRSNAAATLDCASAVLARAAAKSAARHNVTFDLGPRTASTPAAMSEDLATAMARVAQDLSIPAPLLPSGAGHDAATFAAMGVPTGMIFLRNANGSHNPDEHMEMADFAAGAEVLLRLCRAGGVPRP